MNELISVIIPVYNVEAYLAQCLDSVLNQSYQNLEVIVVNDGSLDGSQKIIDRYAQKDQRVFSYIKENGGLSDARNFGLKKAHGAYIFFLDSDDFLESDCLFKMHQALLKDQLDMVVCGYNIYEDGLKTPVLSSYQITDFDYFKSKDALNDLPHCAWNKLAKKQVYQDVSFPFGLYYEDCATTPILYLKAQRFSYLKEALINYRLTRKGNITSMVNPKIIDIFENLKLVLDYYRNHHYFEEFYFQLRYFCLDNIFSNMTKLKGCLDHSLIDRYLNQAYSFLDREFSDWRQDSYFSYNNIKGFVIYLMKTNRAFYRYFLMRKCK